MSAAELVTGEPPRMNEHALRVIEFPEVLALVAERATSTAGAARVRSLAPTSTRAWLEAEHARVAAMRALVAGEDAWRPHPIPEMGDSLSRLRVEGAVWSEHELLAGAVLLGSSHRTREELTSEKRSNPAAGVLSPYVTPLLVARAQETAIERAVDAEGTIRDGASPALRRVRRELRGSQGELVGLLERLMARLEPHQRVDDMSVTVRNGRYVIPVRREARGAIGGIVHDESATRGTLFVEPPAAVEAGNRIRELEADEAREVQRILRELTDQLRPLCDGLIASLGALVELDALFARARYAIEFGCAPAALSEPSDGFTIRDGRHPLLLARGAAVVPFDLEMNRGERTLLVSGPNTGGKTVLLKAVGLMSALMQAGIPAPVGAESRIAIFDDLFADIGDEQSIQASLSTFSAHVRNLGEILASATPSSLVLMDELGAGTDPVEGAALGGAILEELTSRGTMTVATTHLGALKLLSAEVPAIVNASLQFDSVALAPTYRVIKGIPGRSYGLSIARRLRLPETVLVRAEQRVPKGERDVAALLADLEQREAALAERERDAADAFDRAHAMASDAEERERTLREAERALEKSSRQEARRYLLDARAEIEETIASLRARGVSDDAAAREARRNIEQLVENQTTALASLDEASNAAFRRNDTSLVPLTPGDVVEVATLGGKPGQIVEFRGKDAVVAVGALKVTVPLAMLSRGNREAASTRIVVPALGDTPELSARTEIDLRGMRVDEIDGIVMHALDSAVQAELKVLRIIHGKGTGALRERVGEMLRVDDRVKAFRLGAWNEGGAGVTVAELR